MIQRTCPVCKKRVNVTSSFFGRPALDLHVPAPGLSRNYCEGSGKKVKLRPVEKKGLK